MADPQDMQHGLTPGQVATVFPCHFVLDGELRFQQFGPTLQKLLPELVTGAAFETLFTITSPHVAFDFNAISEQTYTIFFLTHESSKTTIRGQFLLGSDTKMLIFVGNPVVRDMETVVDLNLSLKDFAIHDSVIDLLLILQAKTNTIDDTKRMAKQLRQEVNERRTAQKELQATNEQLEARVLERTHDLQIANSELSTHVNRLERHNHEMRLLNRMGDMLQACRSLGETYEVIRITMQELFENSSGTLALMHETPNDFLSVLHWGAGPLLDKRFSKEQCWALRRARLQTGIYGVTTGCFCNHISENGETPYACVPLLVQGEILGLFHIVWDKAHLEGNDYVLDADGDMWQLLQTAADHVALAIANIKLQETLRAQSLRDPLTGIYNRRYMVDALQREIIRAKRAERSMGIIMLDVDHFKQFNDKNGHTAGDAMLRELGAFLQRHIRGDDIACRYGGEEFILILPNASVENSVIRAEQIRREAERHLYIITENGRVGPVTLSIGVSAYPDFGLQSNQLIESADKALYEAKHAGRNRVVQAGLLQTKKA